MGARHRGLPGTLAKQGAPRGKGGVGVSHPGGRGGRGEGASTTFPSLDADKFSSFLRHEGGPAAREKGLLFSTHPDSPQQYFGNIRDLLRQIYFLTIILYLPERELGYFAGLPQPRQERDHKTRSFSFIANRRYFYSLNSINMHEHHASTYVHQFHGCSVQVGSSRLAR